MKYFPVKKTSLKINFVAKQYFINKSLTYYIFKVFMKKIYIL